MSEMTEAATPATEQTADAAEIEVAFGQAENCLHCVSRSGLPTTFVVTREAEQQKRDANIIAPQVLKRTLLLAPSFAPTLTARQNAPPGAIGCRHLLLNIFII